MAGKLRYLPFLRHANYANSRRLRLMRSRRTCARRVLRLLHKPAFFGAAENLRQSHGHFRRYPALFVNEFGQRVARYAKSFGGVRNCQLQRLDTLLQNHPSGMRWVFQPHGSFFFLVVIDIVNVLDLVAQQRPLLQSCAPANPARTLQPEAESTRSPGIGSVRRRSTARR
jgi:hypothetical protein